MRCFKIQHKADSRAGNKINRKCRWPELDHKESWVPKNWCFWAVVLEKTLESPLNCKEIKPVNLKGNQSWIIHWKDRCWSWSSSTLATWCEGTTHWKRPRSWERLKAGREGSDRELDGWMVSSTQRTWVWVNSRSWWWTGTPGVLPSMGSQRFGHDWATEQHQRELRAPANALIQQQMSFVTLGKWHVSGAQPPHPSNTWG